MHIFRWSLMNLEKSKREIQIEIERERRKFLTSGRRVQRLAPGPDEEATAAKPRKQRMKMLA